VVKFERVFEDR
jgi:serine/threonine protein kinase